MNSLVVALISGIFLVLGYVLYSKRIQSWIGLNEDEETPAVKLNDGVDYVPAKHWSMVFGHHFASIAGAAPIIGPVIACLFWGWLPALIWIIVGGTLFGAVHDFVTLFMSLKHEGKSIASITESVLGKTNRILFSVFALLALILVVAVFAAVAGKTLANTPQVVVPTFGLIVVAFAIGFMMYRLQATVLLSSIVGVVLLFILIIIGYKVPISLPFENAEKWWTIILLIYGLIASVTPVNLLLQPRDHLAGAVLYIGMFFGFLGLIISHPPMRAPAMISFSSAKGDIWPMLFVVIACGAISGFHSLVASGTTSKQLAKMKDARVVGYGGMIMESALSLLAIICVSAGLYWSTAPEGSGGVVYQEVFKKDGWIGAFGSGYGQLTGMIFGGVASLVGITMLKTFVMTTLDSATRITRYLANELLGETFNIPGMKNKYIATIFVGVAAGVLALGNWKAIWPVFGASNQLIASMVLIVASVYLIERKRKCFFTAVPAALMLVTTLGALGFQIRGFLAAEKPNYMLAVVASVLIVLALFLTVTSLKVSFSARKRST